MMPDIEGGEMNCLLNDSINYHKLKLEKMEAIKSFMTEGASKGDQ